MKKARFDVSLMPSRALRVAYGTSPPIPASVSYWQAPVISFFDNTLALPVGPAIGDRYVALVTAHGWTAFHIYQWNGAAWANTTPKSGYVVIDNSTNQCYQFYAGIWNNFTDGGNAAG